LKKKKQLGQLLQGVVSQAYNLVQSRKDPRESMQGHALFKKKKQINEMNDVLSILVA